MNTKRRLVYTIHQEQHRNRKRLQIVKIAGRVAVHEAHYKVKEE